MSEVDGIIHYCVANMPGAVPLTSTMALTNATLPYAVTLANKGLKKCALKNKGICEGLNVVAEKITYVSVADVFGMEYTPVAGVLV